MKKSPVKFFAFFLLTVISLLFFAFNTDAEQLPVKTYTIAEGLARDYVHRIEQDSHGFIWFCTAENISRFDGYNFTNYGIAEGLPHRFVTDFLETRDGNYLFGTQGGMVEFNPNGTNPNGSYFTTIPLGTDAEANSVRELIEDPEGVIWFGTIKGLYRLTKTENGGWQPVFIDEELAKGESIHKIGNLKIPFVFFVPFCGYYFYPELSLI